MATEKSSFLRNYRYPLLVGAYILITGGTIFRVIGQPYNRSMKADQIETIFKATTLGGVLLSIGISGKLNRPRSERRLKRPKN